MSVKNKQYVKYDNYEDHYSIRSSLPKPLNKCTLSSTPIETDSVEKLGKFPKTDFVIQIVFIKIQPNNFYEARMLLAPEVDLSSLKITVKGNNLRVTVIRPLKDELMKELTRFTGESLFRVLLQNIIKHQENLLIPDVVDGNGMRALVDNKSRLLFLTAPTVKSGS